MGGAVGGERRRIPILNVRTAGMERRYLSSPAMTLISMATMNVPNRNDSSPCFNAVRRIDRSVMSVSDT